MSSEEIERAVADGVRMIAFERACQRSIEGSASEDDGYDDAELAYAAAAYAVGPTLVNASEHWVGLWPWTEDEFNSDGDRIQHLARAGALIAAEIDRLQRAKRTDPAVHALAQELLQLERGQGHQYDISLPYFWEWYDRADRLLDAARPHLPGAAETPRVA